MDPLISTAAEKLKANKSEILVQWSQNVGKIFQKLNPRENAEAVESMSIFVDCLAENLQTLKTPNKSCLSTASRDHGTKRALAGNYDLNEVLQEYEYLYTAVLNALNSEGSLSVQELSVISQSFFNATREAASAFVQTMQTQQLDSSIQFERLVLDAKDVAIFIISPEGIIKTWNEGAKRIKRFEAEEVIGHHYRMLFREEDRLEGRPEKNLKLALANGRHEEQWWRIRKDGSTWWAEAILSAFYSTTGELLGIAKIVRDLSEKKKTDDDLRQAKAQAEEASQLKSTFVANMSHEIRTPLGAILGFAEMLKDSELTQAERNEFSGIVERNGKTLLKLIDDILDISKIEAGKLDIDYAEIPIRYMIPEVVALFELKAREKKILIDFDIHEDVPEYMTTDPVRARQIITNLLSNAVKFTERGAVHVVVTPKSTEGLEPIRGIEIVVSDSGPGIDKDKRDRIFGEFSQADASVTRRFGGTGLGLALSRKLARKLGGDLVMLDCVSGIGCAFKLTLADQKEAINKDTKESRIEVQGWKNEQRETLTYPFLKQSHILLVEDSPDIQKLVKRVLTKFGARVECANNGVDGLSLAQTGNFDVVLMDVQMPLKDGNEVTRELRAKGYKKPIIAMTAHAMLQDRSLALHSGCNDYLTKPVDVKQMLSLLEKWANPHFVATSLKA